MISVMITHLWSGAFCIDLKILLMGTTAQASCFVQKKKKTFLRKKQKSENCVHLKLLLFFS